MCFNRLQTLCSYHNGNINQDFLVSGSITSNANNCYCQTPSTTGMGEDIFLKFSCTPSLVRCIIEEPQRHQCYKTKTSRTLSSFACLFATFRSSDLHQAKWRSVDQNIANKLANEDTVQELLLSNGWIYRNSLMTWPSNTPVVHNLSLSRKKQIHTYIIKGQGGIRHASD